MLKKIIKSTLPVVLSLGFCCVANGFSFDDLEDLKVKPENKQPDKLETPDKIKKLKDSEKEHFHTYSVLPGDTPWVYAGAKWDPARSGQKVDLDLNVTITKGEEIIGSVNYRNQEQECKSSNGKWYDIIKKSFDDTTGDGAEGAEDEAIGVNLDMLREMYPEADGVYFTLTSFTRQTFGDVKSESLDLYTFKRDEQEQMANLFDRNYSSFSENSSEIKKRLLLTTYNLDNDRKMSRKKAVMFVRIKYMAETKVGSAWVVQPIGEACSVESNSGITVTDCEDDIIDLIKQENR